MTVLALSLWAVGGGAVVAASLVHAGWLVGDAVRRSLADRRRRRLEAELLAQRVAAARTRRVEEEAHALHWKGWRKFVLDSRVREDAEGEQHSYHLRPHDGKAIPAFKPGQYLTFKTTMPGESTPTVRCYSLSDAPREDHYRVTVKRVGPPPDRPDLPPGKMSNYLADEAAEGEIVDLQAPNGDFCLDTAEDRPVVLIGGGIGMTPVLAMLNHLTESSGKRPVHFFYGVRHGGEHIFRDALREAAREHHEQVSLHVCYSRPREGVDERGRDYDHHGRVSVDLLREVLPDNNHDFYVCGPPAMMDTLPKALREWGVPRERVHTESFGPSSTDYREAQQLDPSKASGPTVTFRRSGVSAPWNTDAEDLLSFAAAEGVQIPGGCLRGDCGTCMVAIQSGEVEHNHEVNFPFEEGTCLACCCKPKSAVELDA